jgi:peptidyl-prolyl cis-trans isomerase C
MRKAVMVPSIIFVLSSAFCLVGCDQIQGMFSPSLGQKGSSAPKAAVSEQTPVVQGTVLAKVNGAVITVEDFDEKVKNIQAASPETKIDTLNAKKDFLNNLVTQELVVQEARQRGIDKKKEIRDAIEEFKKNVIARQLVMDETRGIIVQESEINDFYNTYKKQYFTTPSQTMVREIVLPTEAAAKEALISILQGGDFAAIAKEKSTGSSAANGGYVGEVKKGSKPDKYLEVVSTLEAGQVSPIFKGTDGFYIVKAEEKKGGVTYVLTDKIPGSELTVHDYVNNILLQQKQEERIKTLTDKLRSEAKIDVKDDLLR